MKNKVLIKLDIPFLDKTFDIFIPVNEVVWKISNLAIKSCSELSGIMVDTSKKYVFVNKVTDEVYMPNMTIYESNIRNGTELLLICLDK